MWIRRDDGSGGGGQTAAGDADNKDQDPGANGDDGNSDDADGDVDWAVEGPKLKTGLEELNTKFDKQANELGVLRVQGNEYETWKKALKENPKTALPALAKEYGLDVTLKEPEDPNTLIKQMGEEGQLSAEKVVELVKHLSSTSRASIIKEMEPTVRAVHHAHLRTKFPDFDSGADGRANVETQFKAGLTTQDELFHQAWRGANLDAAIKAAVEKAEAGKEAEFAKKLADMGIPGGSAGQAAKPKTPQDGRQKLSDKVEETMATK
jgi:hypothetical protein